MCRKPTGTEYIVVKGDTLGKIAKTKFGVTLKALEDANPGVQPTKLKVGQKLTIPAGGSAAPAATGGSASPDMTASGGEIYVVKSRDSMTKIAKAHGVSLKALKAANPNVDPSHIKVGQKLKIPAKPEAAASAAADGSRACARRAGGAAGHDARAGCHADRTVAAAQTAAGI